MTNTIKNTANAHERAVERIGQIAIAGVLLVLLMGMAFTVVNAQGQDDRIIGVSSVGVLSDTKPVGENITKKVSENAKKALKYIAKTHSVSEEELEIVNEEQATFSLTNHKLWAGKIFDKKSGRVYGVYIDKNGNIADFKKAKEKEDKAHKDKYGKLESALYEKSQEMNSDDKIGVEIWVTSIDSEKIERDVLSKHLNIKTINEQLTSVKTLLSNKNIFTSEEVKNIRDEIFKEKKKAYKSKEKPLIDYMKQKGLDVGYASIAAPVVFANLTKKEILELEKREDVDTIYLSRTYEPETNSAVPTIRAPYVWSRGYNGSGAKIAIVEADKVDFTHPNLAHANCGSYNSTGAIGDHATVVAGIIASNNNIYRGVSSGACILSANSESWSDSDLIAASDWALNNGANVLSCSFGVDTDLQMDVLDRYYDHVIWEHYRAVVKSAGNRGNNDGDVTSPRLAYNVITVGGTNDANTQHWIDDTRATFSSYKDPISAHGDRNKPEVSAVAQDVTGTITGGGWGTGSGTSFAAPAVSGELALLIEKEDWLKWWPEVTKAIVMTTAVHDTYTGPMNGNYDDQEGVGTIVASQAYRTVSNGWMEGSYETASSLPKDKYFYVEAGEKV